MIDMTDEQIAEDRIMRNTNFVDEAVYIAIQLVVDVAIDQASGDD